MVPRRFDDSTDCSRLLGILSDLSVIHSCLRACSGVIRFSGSHSKHRVIRSKNGPSFQCAASARLRIFGVHFRLLECSVTLISPLGWKNWLRLGDIPRSSADGRPRTEAMIWICSLSLSPGKSGYPLNSSTRIHPNDHMSIPVVYGIPRMISGAR